MRLLRHTIWNPVKLGRVPPDYQSIYTTLFPGLYLLYVVYGLASLPSTILSIDVLFGAAYGDFWSYALIAGGALAFIGQVVRPARSTLARERKAARVFRQLELFALCLVIVLEVLYQIAIAASGLMGTEPTVRWLAILAIVVYLGPACWKLRDTVRKQRAAL